MNNNKLDYVKVNDKFQNYIKYHFPDLEKYSLLNELIFYGIFIYYYYFGPIENSVQNFSIIKYIILILIIRYVFSSLTCLEKDKKIKYQLNSKLAIFIIIILFLSKYQDTNITITMLIISGYTLLTSSINIDSTTVDNILTTITILYIYSLNLIN